MSRHIPRNDALNLYIRSGRRCAMPECKVNLIPEIAPDIETNISEIAHIVPFGDNGPRSNERISDPKKNSYQNLLLLCVTCHTIIDKNPIFYTVKKLLEIKYEHEKWVLDQRGKGISNIGFSELDVILKYLISNQITVEDSYHQISLTPKIKKNNLSTQVAQLIMRGMIGQNQVKNYVDNHPDIEYGNRIREGFVNKYDQLYKNEKLTGDEMFYRLLDFAALHSNDPQKEAAGLSVLVYLFEACEVFEK